MAINIIPDYLAFVSRGLVTTYDPIYINEGKIFEKFNITMEPLQPELKIEITTIDELEIGI